MDTGTFQSPGHTVLRHKNTAGHSPAHSNLQDKLQKGEKQSRAKGNQIFLNKAFHQSRFVRTCRYITFSFNQIGFPDLPLVFDLKGYYGKKKTCSNYCLLSAILVDIRNSIQISSVKLNRLNLVLLRGCLRLCVYVLILSTKVKVKFTQLFLTLCNPMDYTVHGILQTRILEWVDCPYPGIEPRSPV